MAEDSVGRRNVLRGAGIAAGGVPFGQSFTGGYVWHCHILDHEDNEMMQKYEVV